MVEEKKLNIQVTCHIEQSKTHAVTKRKNLLKADVRQQHPLYYQWFLLQNINIM